MKTSSYNLFRKYDNHYLYYNALFNAYLILKPELHHIFESNKENIDQLSNTHPKLFNTLLENNFIVDSQANEYSQVMYSRLNRKFSNSIYHIIINPTLNCNLECWYCYEKHVPGSKISDALINNIKNHIITKFNSEPFCHLVLSFFGGEPMLRVPEVIALIKFIKDFTIQNKISLQVAFTTNGTTINKKVLDTLKDCKSSFQITLDGARAFHDKVRHFKKANKGSYDVVLNTIKKVQENLDDVSINIRINYDSKTLKCAEEMMNDLQFLDNRKATIGLFKVWQVEDTIEQDDLVNAIETILNSGYIVDYSPLAYHDSTCYADNHNQVIINYDGQVFKCTARDFIKENNEGHLLNDGTIQWNTERLIKRLTAPIPEYCKKCNLLPSCPGICSQKSLEGEHLCLLDHMDLSFENYLAYNFKRTTLEEKINATKAI